MNDVAAKSAKKTAAKTKRNTLDAKPAPQRMALDRCYGQIGISAVAAAVRYQGGRKNPAYAPVVVKWDDRRWDAA
jgi:hypothetical protein